MDALRNAVADLQEEKALALVRELLASGQNPQAIAESCRRGMEVVAQRFRAKRYSLADLVAALEIFRELMALLGPHLQARIPRTLGETIIFGTPQGDIHDIGKNIVVAMLRASGFEVIDLGVDVPPQVFVDEVRRTGSRLLGMSCLVTMGIDSMRETVRALERAGLRQEVRIMIGGAPVDERALAYVGADGWARDAVKAVALANTFVKSFRSST